MVTIPAEHIADSHKLLADGIVELFEITPSGGSGTIYVKNDNNATWQGNTYTGFPISLSGEKRLSDTGLSMPKMTLGDGTLSLSPFKPLVYDGYLDNAVVVRKRLLLDNLINNRLIYEGSTYRIKRVEEYSRLRITAQLATISDSLGFSMPYRTYLPPDFPSVQM